MGANKYVQICVAVRCFKQVLGKFFSYLSKFFSYFADKRISNQLMRENHITPSPTNNSQFIISACQLYRAYWVPGAVLRTLQMLAYFNLPNSPMGWVLLLFQFYIWENFHTSCQFLAQSHSVVELHLNAGSLAVHLCSEPLGRTALFQLNLEQCLKTLL